MISYYRRTHNGELPEAIKIARPDLEELARSCDPLMPLSDERWRLKVMGVSVYADGGPYPWGSFPDA